MLTSVQISLYAIKNKNKIKQNNTKSLFVNEDFMNYLDRGYIR